MLFFVVAFLMLVCVAAVASLWRPAQIAYHASRLRALRAAGATEGGRQVIQSDHLLEADEHYREIFRLGAVQEGMSYHEMEKVIGPADSHALGESGMLRACRWETVADDGCWEGFVVTFRTDGRADFVPHERRKDEPGGSEASGHGQDGFVRYPTGPDHRWIQAVSWRSGVPAAK